MSLAVSNNIHHRFWVNIYYFIGWLRFCAGNQMTKIRVEETVQSQFMVWIKY